MAMKDFCAGGELAQLVSALLQSSALPSYFQRSTGWSGTGSLWGVPAVGVGSGNL